MAGPIDFKSQKKKKKKPKIVLTPHTDFNINKKIIIIKIKLL